MIKKIIILVCVFLSCITANSQNKNPLQEDEPCGTVVPPQQWDDWFNKEVEKFKANKLTGNVQAINYTIPVIVHVVHFGQAYGVYPNIDSNQVKSQIKVLNQDFSGTGYNSANVPAAFAGLVANTNVQFCLAAKDPTGGVLPEKGIDRVNAQANGWVNPSTLSSSNQIKNFVDNTLKPNTVWDPTRYMNIWICDKATNSGLLGYATFPAGTSLTGIPAGFVGNATNDGIWVFTKVFGDVGTLYTPNYDKGRVTVHEAGHWLGLRHVWGDGNCLTDYCNDTPWAKGPNSGCPSQPYHVNLCGAGQSPNGEMTMNFMDYTNNHCQYMFTPDQTTRIQTAMSQGTYRNQLGTHGLCANTTPPAPGPATALFNITGSPCVNQPFTPNNTSTGGPAPSFVWSASPTTATFSPNANAANPAITLGNATTYTLNLIATNVTNTSSYSMVVTASVCPKAPVCIDTLTMIKSTDTLTTYKADNSTLVLGCQSGFAGFLTGTNCYKDKEFAQYYPASTYSDTQIPQVNSVIVLFDSLGTKGALGTQISCKLYGGTVNGGPGSTSLIGLKADSLGKIMANTDKTVTIKYCGTPNFTFTTTKIIPHVFEFAMPLQIPSSGFFASVQTPYNIAGDSIKIFTNTKTNTSNDSSSWVLQFNNTWRTLRYTKNAKVQLAILPQITCRPVVGIKENTSMFNSNITVMPNPNNGQFSLIFTFQKQQNINVKILNSLGQQISDEYVENVTNNLINVDMSGKPQGVYFILVSNGTEKATRKVIITH